MWMVPCDATSEDRLDTDSADIRPDHDPLPMILGLLYSIVCSLLDLLVRGWKTEAALQIEVLAFRHQIRVFERRVHRPRFQPADLLRDLDPLTPPG